MTNLITSDLAELQALEIELHTPTARRNHERLSALLHADFLEFGRSGQRYTKADILNTLPLEEEPTNISASNFELRILGPGIALLTYSSTQVLPDESHRRHTLRTSIWQLTEHGWQMRFHQGTALPICSKK